MRASVPLGLLAALLAVRPARGEEPRLYGPVPGPIAALVGTAQEESLAADAVARLADPLEARDALAVLVLAGDAGLRRAAERLASGGASPREREALLVALDASARPEVDAFFAQAVREPRAEARALAAHGLGAGRTPAAVDALVRFASDPTPLVRAAAVRALFAIDAPEARAARRALPDDRDPRIAELRLRLHRLRGDGGPGLLGPAARGWLRGATEGVRLEGARCLSLPGVPTDVPLLAAVLAVHGASLDETTGFALEAVERASGVSGDAVRLALGRTHGVGDAGAERLVASEALAALLARPGLPPTLRERLVALGVSYLVHPVWVDGTRVDEPARRVLTIALPDAGAASTRPDAGPALVGPVVAALEARAFADPSHGVRLLTALDEEVWLPAVRALADPRRSRADPSRRPVEDPGVLNVDPVVRAAAGALRDLGRIGDAEVARALVDPSVPEDVRRDGLRALAREDPGIALPLLVAALDDGRDPIASTAADVLLGRSEPAARDAIESMLLAPPWRPFEARVFEALVAAADDRAYAFLERAFASADDVLREAAFDAFWRPGSSLRGARAAEVVRRESKRPPPAGDFGTVARALCSVDGKAAVAYVREHLGKARRPGVLLRNLQAVADPGALDLALEVAARTDDPGMLGEVARVVSGPSARDPARTDPFWRRMLSSDEFAVVDDALRHMHRVEHGDFSEYVEPLVRSANEPDTRRVAALRVLVRPWRPELEDLLWTLASDPAEPEDLRVAASRALYDHVSPTLRARAIAWLRDRVDESSAPVEAIAQFVGKGASASEAAALVSILEAALDRRFDATPYFRPQQGDDAYLFRIYALTQAIGVSREPTALDRLAERLFDARFAAYEREVRRAAAFAMPRGGGALSPLSSVSSSVRLHRNTEVGRDADLDVPAPLPVEVRYLIAALKAAPPEESAARLGRVLAAARASGRLASFDDLYLFWLSTDLHYKAHGDHAGAADVLETAIARALPSSGPEDARLDSRVEARAREGRFAEAAALQAEQVRAAARLGAPDLDEEWLERRATFDFLRGAAAAVAGRVEEARDAFRAGLAWLPNHPTVRNNAAWYRALAGFDLEAAAVDARRALALERRLDDEESYWSLDTYGYVLLRQGKHEEAREVLAPWLPRLKPESYPDGGMTLWHYAAASAALGLLGDAEAALVEALEKYERTLEPWFRRDPLLAPLHGRIDAIATRAAERRRTGE